MFVLCFFFFFSSRRRHTSWNCDWSSDVCSSDLVRRAWTAVGIKTSVKAVDRGLYTEHYRSGDIEIGYWSWDRASANKADPGRWLAYQDDGPWAPMWGHWYAQNAWAKQEPPADHWVRTWWDLWEKVQT